MQLQDAAVGRDREVRIDVQEALERVLGLEATGHLVQHQGIDRLRIPLVLPQALVRACGEVDDA